MVCTYLCIPLASDELHCPKCRVVTRLPGDGVVGLPMNYALREVAEALEDEITMVPPLGSMGHHYPHRQQSGRHTFSLNFEVLYNLTQTKDVSDGHLDTALHKVKM